MKACGIIWASAWTLVIVWAMPVAAQIKIQRLSFAPGTSSAAVKGSVTGDEIMDYKLGARAGQKMSVTLKTSNTSNYFNVLPPGSKAALFNGSSEGNQWTGNLPVDGDYTVRVYLMRSAARRKEKASYTLTVGISGSPDANVAGTPYHATGKVPCSVGPDPKGSAQCSFGVIRSGAGKAEVYLADPGFDVSLHNDKLRILRFEGSNVTSSNPKDKVAATKQGDNWSISVNDFNFYTIPEAVINGG